MTATWCSGPRLVRPAGRPANIRLGRTERATFRSTRSVRLAKHATGVLSRLPFRDGVLVRVAGLREFQRSGDILHEGARLDAERHCDFHEFDEIEPTLAALALGYEGLPTATSTTSCLSRGVAGLSLRTS